MVESSDKTWSSGEGNGKPFLPWEPHEKYEKVKRYDTESKLPRSLGSQYATGEEQRNSSRRNEEDEPKQKKLPAVGVSGGESRVLTL